MAVRGYACAQHVSRTDEKGAGGLSESADARHDDRERDEPSFVADPSPDSARAGCGLLESEGALRLADETKRTRLIGDIMQLVRDTSTPECARVAGLTFVGWLARRRLEEVPHAVGIDEARESERRIRSVRPKAR
jgi:hypothetical protein